MKHLLLLGTGGTIACKRGENGLTPLLTGDELLSYVPDAKKFCEVETIQVLNIDSTNTVSYTHLDVYKRQLVG